MSNEHRGNAVQMSDLELDAILRAADSDLASALGSVTDTAEGHQSAVIVGLQKHQVPLNDQDLDATLQAADADLASALESATNTAEGSRTIVDEAIRQSQETVHPSYLGLAHGA